MDQAISAAEWKRMRLDKGLTQTELAAVAGLSSQGVVSNVENGLRPGPATERRLREVLCPQRSGALEEVGADA